MPKQRKPGRARTSEATDPVDAMSVAATPVGSTSGSSSVPAEAAPAGESVDGEAAGAAIPGGSVDTADGDPVAAAGMLLQPSRAELATAKQAATEPAFAGLAAPRQTIPRQPVPAGSDAAQVAGSRTKARRIVTTAVAVVTLATTVFVVTASEPTDVLAGSAPVTSSPAPPSVGAPPPFLSVGTGTASNLLVTTSGQVLYYNDQDGAPPASIPACVAACAQVWAPLTPLDGIPLTAGPGVFGFVYTIVRPDGRTQITFNGHPLYVFTIDGPGNMTGNNLTDTFDGNAFSWHAASATTTPVIPSPSASPSPLFPPTPSLSPSR